MPNPPLRRPWRIEVEGLDRLPSGPVMLVVNRVGRFDHLQVSASLGRPASVVTTPGDGLGPAAGVDLARWSADPTSRDHPAAALGRGRVLVVFPEGAAGNDGRVHRGHAEFAALALDQGVPVVPAGLRPGSRAQADPASRTAGLRRRLPDTGYRLRIGTPIDLTRFGQVGAPSDIVDGLMLRGVADLAMTRICQLSGRSYHDSYTGRRHGRATGPGTVGRLEQLRRDRTERKAADAQRRAAEAELARLLDEQEAAAVEQAAEAARAHAEQAALADERSRAGRRLAGLARRGEVQ